MLKLGRNAFGNEDVRLSEKDGNALRFDNIQELHKIQEEGMSAGNKISKYHVHFHMEKMKVSLAAQTTSSSTADALDYLRDDLLYQQFSGSEATVKFLRLCDSIFDLFT